MPLDAMARNYLAVDDLLRLIERSRTMSAHMRSRLLNEAALELYNSAEKCQLESVDGVFYALCEVKAQGKTEMTWNVLFLHVEALRTAIGLGWGPVDADN
ncbi:uncharacterized protein IWZ02DRAFT_487004 [Phyllosticta citriasiana]|uniref:uncharacterized protein n=1 Tax=Phyllosticta citriasiana TaxID=595635 RepID=UPI0030FDE64B